MKEIMMCECKKECCCTKHPHAELMIQYAQDALEHRSPELLWEYRTSAGQNWKQCIDCPTWQPVYQYRRKPRVFYINGHEVPEPVRTPLKNGDQYFVPSLSHSTLVWTMAWDDQGAATISDFKRGLVHTTREAAKLHAKALLSFTAKGDE